MKNFLILILLTLVSISGFGQGASRLGGNNAMADQVLTWEQGMDVFRAAVILTEDYNGRRTQPATRQWARGVLQDDTLNVFEGEQQKLFASILRRMAAREWDGVNAAMNAALSHWTAVVPSGAPAELGSGAKGCLAGGQCAQDNGRGAGNYAGKYVSIQEARGLTPQSGQGRSDYSGSFDAKKEWRRIRKEMKRQAEE